MKIVFRVDASRLIGSGHVMRCLVLADELKRNGHQVLFACLTLYGDMRPFITERGFDVISLSPPQSELTPTHDTDYTAWLQKSVDEDAKDFILNVVSADLVITDHYAIGKEWQSQIIKALQCRLVAIDDLARCHQADLILDQTLGRSESDYVESSGRVLVGCEYALLKRDFANKREAAVSRELTTGIPKILISMGGVDSPNATLKVLKALYANVDADFTVLLPPSSPHFEKVKEWCSRRERVEHIEFIRAMASLMLKHDVAIGAPGTTSWERACLGLPNIVVPLADNQKMICEQLVNNNATIQVNLEDIPSRILEAYQEILTQWDSFKSSNLALCDGRGVKRVVLELDYLFSNKTDHVSLVYASHDDISLVYEWQCHPETRKYALRPAVPTRNEHRVWMAEKLSSVTDYFYLVTDRLSGMKIGAVRLDRVRTNHYLISIFVDPTRHGQGIASRALAIIDAIHPDITIHATILRENLASQRLFQKVGYQKVAEQTYIRQPVE
ncbi:UDP-2,4-diacetamido-2,4,6-trideoxy-beta-L-altropyranose hydrolase [Vibrio profundi]|uniref:UDP-2,4-diacetamido-2,4, 6-trideoxy-beta-L-altropyranose hydrolase n=1 Tax=Vibrio profundi TaxID=1774960 RepID=UPI0037359B22